MFCGFNLQLTKTDIIDEDNYTEGFLHLKKYKSQVDDAINNCALNRERLYSKEIEKEWFPNLDVDVFISHSHKDEKLAICLAGWLHKTFDLNCFIDSCIWNDSKDLVRNLNDEYSVLMEGNDDEGKTYDYNKANSVATNVNLILSISLAKMIKDTECLIFLNTPSSIFFDSALNKNTTTSPWIYFELEMSKMLKTDTLKRNPISHSQDSHFSFSINFDPSLDHLLNLSEEDLFKWEKEFANQYYCEALDILYKIKGAIVLNEH